MAQLQGMHGDTEVAKPSALEDPIDGKLMMHRTLESIYLKGRQERRRLGRNRRKTGGSCLPRGQQVGELQALAIRTESEYLQHREQGWVKPERSKGCYMPSCEKGMCKPD